MCYVCSSVQGDGEQNLTDAQKLHEFSAEDRGIAQRSDPGIMGAKKPFAPTAEDM